MYVVVPLLRTIAQESDFGFTNSGKQREPKSGIFGCLWCGKVTFGGLWFKAFSQWQRAASDAGAKLAQNQDRAFLLFVVQSGIMYCCSMYGVTLLRIISCKSNRA